MRRPRVLQKALANVLQGRAEIGHWLLLELSAVSPEIVFRVQQLASLGEPHE
jgi:hypothetical protein